MKTQQPFYAYSRQRRLITRLSGFTCWEQVQGAFRCGIEIERGVMADAIGRDYWPAVRRKALSLGFRIIVA